LLQPVAQAAGSAHPSRDARIIAVMHPAGQRD
jgi:hypothetical protein